MRLLFIPVPRFFLVLAWSTRQTQGLAWSAASLSGTLDRCWTREALRNAWPSIAGSCISSVHIPFLPATPPVLSRDTRQPSLSSQMMH